MKHFWMYVVLWGTLLGSSAMEPARHPFLERADNAFEQGKYPEAVHWCDLYNRNVPDDPMGWIYFGVALNRTGDFSQARIWLERGSVAASEYPGYEFERGWARMETGDLEGAKRDLLTHLQSEPQDAKAYEFLGRTCYRLGETDEAERHLRQALRLNPGLASTVHLYLGGVAKRKGQPREAVRLLEESVLVQNPRIAFPIPPAVDKGSGWEFQLSVSGGYDDNAIALADGQPLPGGVTGQSGAFAGLGFGAARSMAAGESEWTFRYTGQAQVYESALSAIDSSVHQVGVTWVPSLAPGKRMAATGFHQYSTLDGETFRNRSGLQAAGWWTVSESWALEATPSLYADRYAGEPPTKALDRDAWNPGVILAVHQRSTSGAYSLSSGVEVREILADGNDYDATVFRMFLGGRMAGPAGTRASAFWFWTRESYANANSLSGSGDARDDTQHRLLLEVAYPIYAENRQVSREWYLRYLGTFQDSNLDVYTYDQHIVNAGVRLWFF